MRLPLKGTDYVCKRLNPAAEDVQKSYLDTIVPLITMRGANAMLGDGTVTQANTFDPAAVRKFYQRLAGHLTKEGWSCSQIATSDTDDLRRIFFQSSKEVGKHYLTGDFGLQYHALPYYKVDKRVIEIQKELAAMADRAGTVFGKMAGEADSEIRSELQKRGYAELEFQELFTKMFDDEKLVQELDSKAAAVEQKFSEFEDLKKRKAELFGELNDLLIEMYQTSPVAIDHNRQMQGEEGVTTYFDLESIKNKKTKSREAYIDPSRVTKDSADRLAKELAEVGLLIRKSA